MARGVGRTGSGRPVLSELQQNGDPPASTLAAQLVTHLTDGKKHPKNQDRETFRLLLREVLSAESEQSSQAQTHGTDNDVNHKLVFVIVKAGLETLTNGDPFGGQVERSRQAIDSLAAIEYTITKNPEILFVLTPDRGLGSNPHPLFLWLIPKVLAVAAQMQDSMVIEQVLKLLRMSLLLARKTHIKGVRIYSIARYIKGCIKASAPGAKGYGNVPQPHVPSATTISAVYPGYPLEHGSHDAIQIRPQTRIQVANITTCLLCLSATTLPGHDIAIRTINSSSDQGRVLSELTRFWHSITSKGMGVDNSQVSVTSLVLFLDCLRSFCLHFTAARYQHATLLRFSILFSQTASMFLIYHELPLASPVESSLCLGLIAIVSVCQQSKQCYHYFADGVLPAIAGAENDKERFDGFGQDLQCTIRFSNRFWKGYIHTSLSVPSFRDPRLQQYYHDHIDDLMIDAGEDCPRPQKRARISTFREEDMSGNPRLHIINNIRSLLGSPEGDELTSLSQIAVDYYPKLSEEEQCTLCSSLGSLACASAGTLAVARSRKDNEIQQSRCSMCDNDSRCESAAAISEHPDLEEAMRTIANLIKLSKAQKYRRPRVAAMLALKHLLSHTANADHLNLMTSPFGQSCLHALHSSIRELRVAAGSVYESIIHDLIADISRRTLPIFLQAASATHILPKNRLVALDFLRGLSEKGDDALQETCILTWGQIARVSTGDEMNLILLKLVEYLGHTNPLICGLAYDEIQRISNHSPFSAMKLFAPYWRTIAITVVQDLHRRPQIAQQVSDLLAMSVPDLLSMTQVHTVPVFVLMKKQDILQRIADASGQSIMSLCRDHNNLAAILSSVLLRTSSDVENVVMSLLNAISPEFSNVDCAELLKSEPQATASELLRAGSEVDEAKKSRAHQALHFLAEVTHGKPTSSRGTARKTDVIGPFFETHVLGIMALLADTINDGKGPQPTLEKIRCLGAIREMIKLAKGSVANGLPQICACLRSAIENKELANPSFDAWIVMMITLGEDEIANLVDSTFAILIEYWDSFQTEIQARAYDMVSHILKSCSSMIRDIAHNLPSLAAIPLMAKFEEDLSKLKAHMTVKHHFQAFGQRCQKENATVVLRALHELAEYLSQNQDFLHEAANSEQPDPVVGQLARSILDTSILFSNTHPNISILCAKCMGLVGCLDPTRIEAVKENREILVLSNFVGDEETNDFVVFFLREILVKAFLSATNSRSQGFLAYAMQELLCITEIRESVKPRSRDGPYDANHLRWVSLPESVRTTLMPFANSKYFVTTGISQSPCSYPLYNPGASYSQWLRTFAFDLLKRPIGGSKVQVIFSVLSRIVRFQDISIPNFLLPFACLNAIVDGEYNEKLVIGQELLLVLGQPLPAHTSSRDNIILCSQAVFRVLDYLSRWMQEKKKGLANIRNPGARTSRSLSEAELEKDVIQVSSVEAVLAMIPTDVISRRAVECKSYSRALFHWEQFIRQQRDQHRMADHAVDLEPLYERLQEIYTQIDEPDGMEGISTHLQVLNIDQQILEHRKAGRWTAAQSWYELQLTERPCDLDVQFNLLTSLKESGQHDVLLNQVEGFQRSEASSALSLPFAAESAWVTGKLETLRKYISLSTENSEGQFNVGIGQALLALSEERLGRFSEIVNQLRRNTVRGLSATNTSSLQGCHEALLKFHVLAEIEMINDVRNSGDAEKSSLRTSLGLRLDALGPFLSDKQYILGIRRAVMRLSKRDYSNTDIAAAWLTSAKLARKGNFTHQAFNAVLHASQLGDESATIEHSRLLWREGSHRKAIRSLEGAISANAFRSYDYTENEELITTNNMGRRHPQNPLKARAHLLLAKWIDRAGQTQSEIIVAQYKKAINHHDRWEKGHYYLGKHYNKLFESEKAKTPAKQAQTFINGETTRLVVENYLRSLAFGAKYIYQTLPRLLTLWLDLGAEAEQPLDPKYGNDDHFRKHLMVERRKMLDNCNSAIKRYTERLPAFVFYTALSQLVARICHSNKTVYGLIVDIVTKVVTNHTPQALWTLLAVVKSSTPDRAKRGLTCMNKVLENSRKARTDSAGLEMKAFINGGQKLSEQLLQVCEGGIDGKPSHISLQKDLGFNHKSAFCKLAIPLEVALTASLPTMIDTVRHHRAFNTRDYIYISSFLDDVLVLNSLQKPRKISIRGSDGHVYALLCKPKDDLRKDQRLMEFNAMINRALKKDAESSKRRLYIKTYAVTPLNEECGLIEWIDNLKTLREILLVSYKQKNVQINYGEIRSLLNESISAKEKLWVFTDKVIGHFPPVFHEWFVEMFPEPGAWFTARLRYTRSCAVMSIVGHVLGLGDRHGENILFEEGNGGTFHVDFNCLFDKGLTFEKPELVPFRLTHNMVDAFGAYGYEGPFRKSCELTLGILRQNEDTLMTILETFLYDPTTDFIGKKKKVVSVVPDTPQGVLDSVNNKVKGLLPSESVPLSVEGYVQALILQATDPLKLASMYIGWCAFF